MIKGKRTQAETLAKWIRKRESNANRTRVHEGVRVMTKWVRANLRTALHSPPPTIHTRGRKSMWITDERAVMCAGGKHSRGVRADRDSACGSSGSFVKRAQERASNTAWVRSTCGTVQQQFMLHTRQSGSFALCECRDNNNNNKRDCGLCGSHAG